MRIALTVGPDCEHAAASAERMLIESGHDVQRYPDENDYESAVSSGLYDAVIDLNVGMIHRHDRLISASRLGLPQIISVGGLANESPRQLDLVGKTIVERASASNGPTRIVLPMAEPKSILFESIRNWVYPPSMLVEMDSRLDTTLFGRQLARELFMLIGSQS
jgi:hypothetical protein